jgi:hypothetical protein
MMRIPVVASQLFSHGNVTSGIEFHSSISNADKHVGITGMIDKLEGSTANAAVDGLGCAKFYNDDSLRSLYAFPGFSHRNLLTRELPQLCPYANGAIRK